MANALELKDVSKKYDEFELKNISIALPQGSIMGLIGENGAGKSTPIKHILDLIRRDGGEIFVLGQDNRENLKSVKEHLGVVLDESCFPENLTLPEIDKILKNIYRTWNGERFAQYARKFSLPKTKRIKDYSHGMRMKLGIAVALSHDSKLLIMDEATSGLDPIARDEILDVFMDFIQNEGHSIFMSSHILSDLEKICDYITFIHKGKVLFSETKDDLIEKYGLMKCSQDEFEAMDKSAVVGCRTNHFGVEALVLRDRVKGEHVIDRVGIEEIMLYLVKERAA